MPNRAIREPCLVEKLAVHAGLQYRWFPHAVLARPFCGEGILRVDAGTLATSALWLAGADPRVVDTARPRLVD